MKQFFLATGTDTKVNTAAGKLFMDDTKGDILEFIFGNGPALPVDSVPVFRENLSYTITAPKAGVNFAASFTCTISSTYKYNEVFVVISKKDAVFNERNVWTTSGHGATANDIAAMLRKNINDMTATHGLVAAGSAAAVSLSNPNDPTQDYSIKVTRVSVGTTSDANAKEEVAITATVTKGVKAICDTAWVKELAHKCIGDKGIGYTHVEALFDTYHSMNTKAGDITSSYYHVLNIRVYNPRVDHRIDEALYQMIHIAVPASSATQDALAESGGNDIVKAIVTKLKTIPAPGTGITTDVD